jgi:hypothetical protein
MHTNNVLQGRLTAENKIFYAVEERFGFFGLGLKFIGLVEMRDVFFESLVHTVELKYLWV